MAKPKNQSPNLSDFKITLFHVETNRLVTIEADKN